MLSPSILKKRKLFTQGDPSSIVSPMKRVRFNDLEKSKISSWFIMHMIYWILWCWVRIHDVFANLIFKLNWDYFCFYFHFDHITDSLYSVFYFKVRHILFIKELFSVLINFYLYLLHIVTYCTYDSWCK